VPAQWDFINWFSGPAPAGSSYVYHMQREDGRLVIGANAAPGSQLDDATGSVSPEVTERLLDEMRTVYPALADVQAEQAWMGVLSWTSDGFPWVGELPSFRGEASRGLYVAAGFGGEGMVRCFASGKAVAEMLTGQEPTLFNPRYLPAARGGSAGQKPSRPT
jgi:glycine/D-amino acid oxidase-like deaminating enzyme